MTKRRLPVVDASPVLDAAGGASSFVPEPDRIFEHPGGVVWRRSGSCCRCGACCRSGNYFADTLGPGSVDGACFYYEERGGLGTCIDRTNVYSVQACSVWPDGPQCVADYPDCSYVFIRIGGDKR